MGVPLLADDFTAKQSRLGYARVLIEVNITKELPKSILYYNEDGKKVVQEVVYEWVPYFCAKCQKMGHTCPTSNAQQGSLKQHVTKQWRERRKSVVPVVGDGTGGSGPDMGGKDNSTAGLSGGPVPEPHLEGKQVVGTDVEEACEGGGAEGSSSGVHEEVCEAPWSVVTYRKSSGCSGGVTEGVKDVGRGTVTHVLSNGKVIDIPISGEVVVGLRCDLPEGSLGL